MHYTVKQKDTFIAKKKCVYGKKMSSWIKIFGGGGNIPLLQKDDKKCVYVKRVSSQNGSLYDRISLWQRDRLFAKDAFMTKIKNMHLWQNYTVFFVFFFTKKIH